jgi:glycogen(starch) synthase
MRILFLSGAFWPVIGGVEVRAAKLLPALRDRGYEFVVATGQSSADLPLQATFQGIPIYRFPFGQIGQNLNLLMKIQQQILKLTRTFAPNLIHRNGVGVDNFFALTAAKAVSVPFLVTLINDLRTQSLSRDTLYGNLLQTADWVNTVSQAALTQLQQLLPDVIPRSSVIHNGIDGKGFVPKPLPTEYPRLLFLGRLHYQKGVDIALRAFAAVLRHVPHARLIVAGDGHERAALQRQTEQLGLTQAVDFLGWIAPEQVPAIIGSATMLVIPSRWEGLPNTALQAAMMGRAVIGTKVGGLPEIVEHQQTGLLVEPENVDALTEAIVSLLKSPQRLFQLGQGAHAKVQKEFSWHHYVDAYDALYRKLILAKSPITSCAE